LATWIGTFGPTATTVIGAFISAIGAFWKFEHDFRAKQESKFETTRRPGFVILFGALLSIIGALWSGQQQSKSAEERTQFEHDLRTRSDQIAGLSREIAGKSDEIAGLNRQIARKSDEIAELSRETSAAVTGGDEFTYLDPLMAENQNRIFLIIVHQGKYPIYDVGFRLLELRGYATMPKPMVEEMLSNTFSVGSLAAHERHFVAYWPVPPGKTAYGFNFFFTARNAGGFTVQQVRFLKVNGAWLSATELTPYNTRRILYRRVDPKFPKSTDGTIDWNDKAYSD
jgi:hypothetical protein